MPDRTQEVKDIFVQEVNTSTYYKYSYNISNLLQLRPYWTDSDAETTTSTGPDANTVLAHHSVASRILGLSRPRRRTASHSLEHEVETYLLDLQEGTSILNYWQVCYHWDCSLLI